MTRLRIPSRMRPVAAFLLVMFFLVPSALHADSKHLHIYFIDTEGGQSTLLVDPQGESLLIDTGYDGFNDRDVKRIMAAVHSSGIHHIDALVLTHYHRDHSGGLQDLAKRIKIDAFFDHGANVQDTGETEKRYEIYQRIAASKRTIVKPGDSFRLHGMSVQVLTSAGRVIQPPLPGAGKPNRLCASSRNPGPDPSENAQSVGLLITFGKFRFLDLGDLTEQKELALACPKNLIGTVDLMITTHHGTFHTGPDASNAKALVDALHPKVAVMNNGAKKGGSPEALDTYHSSPGLVDLWQLHYSLAGGAQHNSPRKFIANLSDNGDGHPIQVLAERNGAFTVINTRNGFRKTY